MRLATLVLMSGLLFNACSKNNNTADSLPGTTYGGEITVAESITLSQAAENYTELQGEEILINGFVQGMCVNKGDWLVWSENDNQLIVQFKDRAYTIPTDATGKKVQVQGYLRDIPLPRECDNAETEQNAAHTPAAAQKEATTQPVKQKTAPAQTASTAEVAAKTEDPEVNRMYFVATAVKILD
ncbi:MAG: DUF4920 domain-containing protein [Candidatus Delongbacteria bacterium]|nr:DUF4920 domain-containing protein [Candidatus Delongbacteria bacterium]